jgi:hypothetical protein
MRVFTKIDGKLVVWQVEGNDYVEAIELVRAELGTEHTAAVLALVKY